MKKQLPRLLTITLAALLFASWMAPAVYANVGGAPAPGTLIKPDPALNPTALFAVSGDYTYVAAGAAMRDQGYGNITVNWTGTLVKAYLIWGYINPTTAGLSGGTFNGQAVTGTFQSTDVSPCWGGGNLTVFAADVTSLVNNGDNHLTGFPSGYTNGNDPWSEYQTPLDEGASLVVVYTPTTAVTNQVYIYTGTYTETTGGSLTSVFNHGATIATTATTTFIVADGQLPGNSASWNGVVIDTNAFPGSDPKVSTQSWSYGNLWDTKTYSVTEGLGSTVDSASIAGGGDDCLTWAAQVLAFPSTASINGVPQFNGSSLAVAAVGMALVVVLAKRKQALQIPTN
ncbi:MAG: hypothetical protein OK456_10855 [Thaumarchaeota archaeon]|nr:hypothetical protein [Nitrososphaerota archaeon]